MFTDGEYWWTSTDTYYFERYNLRLDDGFVKKAIDVMKDEKRCSDYVKIKNFDIVFLKDGSQATINEVVEDGVYIVDMLASDGYSSKSGVRLTRDQIDRKRW